MNQEDINELTDKNMPTWLSDQRLGESGYREALLNCRQNIVELKAEVAQLKDELSCEFTKVCHWSQDDDGAWHGSCGVAWHITEGTPVENYMQYCPKCGAVLLTKEAD
jgi:predicted  nucleic acid-binding Zn-ribbon protein